MRIFSGIYESITNMLVLIYHIGYRGVERAARLLAQPARTPGWVSIRAKFQRRPTSLEDIRRPTDDGSAGALARYRASNHHLLVLCPPLIQCDERPSTVGIAVHM